MVSRLFTGVFALLLLFGAAHAADSCDIFPAPINTLTSTATAVSAACYSGQSEASCGQLNWSSTIGSVGASADSPLGAIFNSGASEGSGAITAQGSGFSCSIPVEVKSPASPSTAGSNGGVSSGSGQFRVSASVLASCAGRPAEIKADFFDASAPAATIEVLYNGADSESKVFSKAVSSTSTITFTPVLAGDYELRVSSPDGKSASAFTISSCASQPAAPNSEVATAGLQASRELALQRSVQYAGGFSKDFATYRVIGSDGVEYYTTAVTLRYAYGGNGTKENFSISDSVPSAVLSKASQITFSDYPSRFSGNGSSFEWAVRSIESGQAISFSYSFPRALTSQMEDSFPAPKIVAQGQEEETVASMPESQPSTNLVASLISTQIFSVPISYIVLAIAGMALVASLLNAIFGRKN